MAETLIGYARCSTDEQDLTAQQERLVELGVSPERIYLDHGLTGTNRARPGLDQALAAAREGDTLVVPKLDRLARSVPDARAIGDDLAALGIKLSLGGQVYDPTDPMGKMLWARCSSTSSPPSPNSRSTSSGCGPAKAWPWLAPEASSAASNPSSHPNSSASSSAWPAPASTPSPTSPNSSPCPARRSTGRFNGKTVRRAEEASAHTARSSAHGDMIITSTPGISPSRCKAAGWPACCAGTWRITPCPATLTRSGPSAPSSPGAGTRRCGAAVRKPVSTGRG